MPVATMATTSATPSSLTKLFFFMALPYSDRRGVGISTGGVVSCFPAEALKWRYGYTDHRRTTIPVTPVRGYWQVPKFSRNGTLPRGLRGGGDHGRGAASESDRPVQGIAARPYRPLEV